MIATFASRRLAWTVVAVGATFGLAACGGSSGGASSPHAFGESGPALPSATPTATASETAVTSAEPPSPSPTRGPFTLTSPAFEPNGRIPAEYTCRGADRSPALDWSGVPAGTGALVLFGLGNDGVVVLSRS